MDTIKAENGKTYKRARIDAELLEREDSVRSQMELVANMIEYSKDETVAAILEQAYNDLLDHIVTLHQPMFEEVK